MRLSLSPSGTSPRTIRCANPLDDGRLADARLADQYRIVLRTAREHLNHPPNFVVATDPRIETVLARQFGQIAAVPLEGLILVFRILIGHTLRATNRGQRIEDPLHRDAVAAEHTRGRRAVICRSNPDQ